VPRVAWCADAAAVAHLVVGALDADLVVGGAEGHHLQRVRRLRPGDAVTAADGAGTWRPYRVAGAAAGRLVLRADGDPRREPALEPALTVACAITKGERPEAVVRQASELGVDAVLPVLTARSVVRWDDARRAAALARLRRVAREAAQQCRRARLLTIEPLAPLAALAGRPGLVVADRLGGSVAALPAPGPAGWTVVVGPEGGLAADERAGLGDPPRLAVGPHVLRAETAATAVAAALAAARQPADHIA
jgi:16S rRNA (uracil1498-N3)-methyltransferase